MGILDIILLRSRVYRLRKKYDRARERADRIRDRSRKLPVLRVLDKIEPTLAMLEEQRLYRMEKKRMIRYVEAGIIQAKDMIGELSGKEKNQQTR